MYNEQPHGKGQQPERRQVQVETVGQPRQISAIGGGRDLTVGYQLGQRWQVRALTGRNGQPCDLVGHVQKRLRLRDVQQQRPHGHGV